MITAEKQISEIPNFQVPTEFSAVTERTVVPSMGSAALRCENRSQLPHVLVC